MLSLIELLPITRPLIGLDLETTGTSPKTSHIVEIGLEIMRPGLSVKEYRTLVNPGVPIPPEATEIHGITNKMIHDAPSFSQLAGNLSDGFTGCDFVGYQVRFDLKQLVESFARVGRKWNYEGARVIDGFRLWQIAEQRKLIHAVEHWIKGVSHVTDKEIYDEMNPDGKAHNALWDIKMSTRVVASQLASCPNILPRDVQKLHDLCWPDWYDAEGKIRKLPDGGLCLTFGEHRDKNLERVPTGYLQWILRESFSDKVKNTVKEYL